MSNTNKKVTSAEGLLEHLWNLRTEQRDYAANAALRFLESNNDADRTEALVLMAYSNAYERARERVIEFIPSIIYECKELAKIDC